MSDFNYQGQSFSVTAGLDASKIGVHQMKEPRVRQKINELGVSLEMLEKSLIELGNKLSDVMRSEETGAPRDAAPVPQEICVIADMVQTRIRHTEHLRGMVDSYLSRLEV